MKQLIINFCFLFFVFSQVSCVYDNAEDLYGANICPPESISFEKKVKPIINSSCALSGCHMSGHQQPTLETYAQISSNADKIRTRTSNGTMPPAASGISLSVEEIKIISCWVETGTPNN